MAKTVAIGIQDFGKLLERGYFYIDKTDFIREWWESGDEVTLITRPRRFGKTLNMSMVEQFFSIKYKDRKHIFQELSIGKTKGYLRLQGTYPVISLSFAHVKEADFTEARKSICRAIEKQYSQYGFLLDEGLLNEKEKDFCQEVSAEMSDSTAAEALCMLSDFLSRQYGKKVIILLDEYDTPMQEAYVNGYWKEMVSFMRGVFNATFKTNPWLERGIMTGITRVSKESIFSDLNNLNVVTATSEEYGASFGFTEEEVFAALDSQGMGGEKERVKAWYDGFTFGSQRDIYNPWSILCFLDKGKYNTYWANTSSNSLVSKLIREGSQRLKKKFEGLLQGGSLWEPLDEQIVYSQLDGNESAIWSLLLASGYLKVLSYGQYEQDILRDDIQKYELALTNHEVKKMFQNMVRGWFGPTEASYNEFLDALLAGDLEAMQAYMDRIVLEVFSYFDTGTGASEAHPENFYHGFVLGLLVDLGSRYLLTSNRESGFGRYDVMLEPKDPGRDDGIIMEFKVRQPKREKSMEETLQAALHQVEEKQYAASLTAKGIPSSRIRAYGFAFQGKEVLIGGGRVTMSGLQAVNSNLSFR